MTVINIGKGLPRHFFPPEGVINIDIWKPYLTRGDILADVRHLPIAYNSVDVIFCIELIEHLEKEEGLKVVKELKKMGKQIIISTPDHFYDTGKLDGNPHQLHKSSYKREDFPDFFFIHLPSEFIFIWIRAGI